MKLNFSKKIVLFLSKKIRYLRLKTQRRHTKYRIYVVYKLLLLSLTYTFY